jgi:Protein of unknown function (DUF3995)
MRSASKARTAAGVAALLGLGHAAVSAYWALGGTALLDTVGGSLEEWARDAEPELLAALWVVVIVKVGAAALGPLLVWDGGPSRLPMRLVRGLAWTATVVLVAYGGILTLTGLLAVADVLPSGSDRTALKGHAFLWDPWFLVWGLALGTALLLTRSSGRRRTPSGAGYSGASARSKRAR